MDTNNVLKRVLPVALIFILILVLAFVFSGTSTKKESYANVSNPSEVFGTVGSIKVTNEEMYDSLITTYGAAMLSQELNEVLFSSYLDEAKSDERFNVNEEYEKAIYNGLTKAEASLVYSSEDLAKFELSFKEKLTLNNLTEDEYKELLYIDYAKVLYTEDKLHEDYKEEYQVKDVASFYENDYYNEATVIQIEFDSMAEALAMYNKFGITALKDGRLYKNYYIDGNLILEDNELYPTDEETLKTLELTDEEVLKAYVDIYNAMNPSSPITLENGEVKGATVISFDDLASQNKSMASYIFKTLNTEDNKYQTYPSEFAVANSGSANETKKVFLTYKLSGDDANSFASTFEPTKGEEGYKVIADVYLDEYAPETNSELYNEVLNELLYNDAKSTTNQNKYGLKAIRDELKLTIYDTRLYSAYTSSVDKDFKNYVEGTEYVYSYETNGTTVNVTADEFYQDLANRYGASKFITLSNNKIYTSDEALIKETITDDIDLYIKSELENYKLAFQNGQFAIYGYTPQNKTWNDFLYEVLGAKSEKDYYNNKVTGFLQSAYLLRHFREENLEGCYEAMKEFYEEDFGVDTRHILVYADVNKDYVPDMTMSEELSAKANELAKIFADKLNTAENFTVNLLATLVKEYNEATIYDETYGEYKLLGLEVMTEEVKDVTSSSSLEENYLTTSKALYDELMANDELEYVISKEPTKTSYGYHVIYASDADNKLDAYPNDGNLVFPTNEDIEKYYDNDSTLNPSIKNFIEAYYVKALEETVNKEATVYLDEVRASMGVTINNPKSAAHYDNIVAINLAQLNRA